MTCVLHVQVKLQFMSSAVKDEFQRGADEDGKKKPRVLGCG